VSFPANHVYGITSRHFSFVRRKLAEIRAEKVESGPDVLIPSFQPVKGERSELSTIDGRTMAIGRSRPCRARIDSPRLFVKV